MVKVEPNIPNEAYEDRIINSSEGLQSEIEEESCMI
jgi:hypothetical protein